MAVNGIFTYRDLYAGRSRNTNYNFFLRTPSNRANEFSSEEDSSPITTTRNVISQSYLAKLVSSTERLESTTKLTKLGEIIPFSYFYWLLVILAILLTLTLITVFTCYCRSFVKNYKARR